MHWTDFESGRIYEHFIHNGGLRLPVGASYSRRVHANDNDFKKIVGHLKIVVDTDKYEFKSFKLEEDIGYLLVIERIEENAEKQSKGTQ